MNHLPPWLLGTLIYLGAAVLAVPLARLLGLGSIIGYLAAGIAIGPCGFALVADPEAVLHFAEFGVVLMLFLVGLELEPRRLWAMRRPIFGWGTLQLGGSALLIALAALMFGVPWPIALVAALGLALSSTAIGLAVLGERNLMPTTRGAERALGDAAAGHRRDSDPGAGAAARRQRRRDADAGDGWLPRGRRRRASSLRSCSAAGCCCGRRCAGSRAAARRRSSPPRRCCSSSPSPR